MQDHNKNIPCIEYTVLIDLEYLRALTRDRNGQQINSHVAVIFYVLKKNIPPNIKLNMEFDCQALIALKASRRLWNNPLRLRLYFTLEFLSAIYVFQIQVKSE